jgi:hypothetical protein
MLDGKNVDPMSILEIPLREVVHSFGRKREETAVAQSDIYRYNSF